MFTAYIQYRKVDDYYQVGFYRPNNTWAVVANCDTEERAITIAETSNATNPLRVGDGPVEEKGYRCDGFVIESPAEPNVGLHSQVWRLSGDFNFDSEYKVEQFKEYLASVFSMWLGHDVYVLSNEEYMSVYGDCCPSHEEDTTTG